MTFFLFKLKALDLIVGVFHRLAVGPWPNYLMSLSLCFCEMELIIAPSSFGLFPELNEIKCVKLVAHYLVDHTYSTNVNHQKACFGGYDDIL